MDEKKTIQMEPDELFRLLGEESSQSTILQFIDKIPVIDLKYTLISSEDTDDALIQVLAYLFKPVYSSIMHSMYGYFTSANSMIAESWSKCKTDEDFEKHSIYTFGILTKALENKNVYFESLYHMIANLNFVCNTAETQFYVKETPTVANFAKLIKDTGNNEEVSKLINERFTDTTVFLKTPDGEKEIFRLYFNLNIRFMINTITNTDPVCNAFNEIDFATITYLKNMQKLKMQFESSMKKEEFIKNLMDHMEYNFPQAYYSIGTIIMSLTYGTAAANSFMKYIGDKPVESLMKLADVIENAFRTWDDSELCNITSIIERDSW